jgi:SpoVK/Ycf46/Vps4 family AAA+-type ATPase
LITNINESILLYYIVKTMSGIKESLIKTIIPVLDQRVTQIKIVTEINKPIKTKKDIYMFKKLIEQDYIRITEDNSNFSGWKPNTNKQRSFRPRITFNDNVKILTKIASTSSIPMLFVNETEIMSNSNNKINNDLPPIKKEIININVEINSIKDVLKLIKDNPIIENAEYNIDIETLHKIKTPLIELDRMIGMNTLKENVIDQIIYYVQKFHKLGNCNGDFMHTVIYGPPGTGKTELAKLIGKIFSKLGILKKGTFQKVTRADLIAGYLGQTAIKTKDVIKQSLGGVLFIDEAYALGNNEKSDSFAKECIDTICEALSDHKDNLMVIIAGYEDELKSCFFSYNTGLESRFTWRFKTDEYNADELMKIFIKKVEDAGWHIDKDTTLTPEWFKKNMDYFKYYGRDMETLFAKCKICHSRRVFCRPKEEKTYLTTNDIENGFALFLKNDEVKSRKDNSMNYMNHMYS